MTGEKDVCVEPHSSLLISFCKTCTFKDVDKLNALEKKWPWCLFEGYPVIFWQEAIICLGIPWFCWWNMVVSGYDGCSLLKSEFITAETGCWECAVCWSTGFLAWLLFTIILCISWRNIWSFFACLSESLLCNYQFLCWIIF